MRRRTPLVALSGITALALSGLLGATAASAATTVGPLFIVGYEDQTLVTGTPTAPGALSQIAAEIPALADFYIEGGDVAPGGTTAYLIAEADGEASCFLIPLDLKTGAAGTPLLVTALDEDSYSPLPGCQGFDIDVAGTAWIFANGGLGTLDLSSGIATYIGTVLEAEAENEEVSPILYFQALASNSDGALYGVTDDGDLYLLHPLDAGSDSGTIPADFIASTGISENDTSWTADFDQNHILWINTYGSEGEGSSRDLLWSFDVTTPDVVAISTGVIKQGERFVEGGALFFAGFAIEDTATPAATLPDTGVATGGALGIAGLLLALGFAGLVFVRRRATV